MLFDYRTLLNAPLLTAGVLAVILLVKPLVALLIVIIGGHSLKTALTVAGGLAQIGEFSFILGDMARSLA
jgi:CPA2 family monovalent cation:H+ antiporter-2